MALGRLVDQQGHTLMVASCAAASATLLVAVVLLTATAAMYSSPLAKLGAPPNRARTAG